jgi:hypothetical protein
MPKVIILGAGASYGAGFKNYRDLKPPLLKDFFKFFKEFNYFGTKVIAERLLNFLKDQFNWTEENLLKAQPDLEEVISTLDEIINRVESDQNFDFKKYRDFYSVRKIVERFINETIHRCTWHPSSYCKPYLSCPYHKKIAGLLQPEDSIITLNYDLIMDMALIEENKLEFPNGYNLHFHYYSQDNRWIPVKKHIPSSFCYLKLHGSLNWFISNGFISKIEYGENNYSHISIKEDTAGRLHLLEPITWYRTKRCRDGELGAFLDNKGYRYNIRRLIIAPTKHKSLNILQELWDTAAERLKNATEVIIAGCSLRKTDEKFISLLKDNVKWNTIDSFVLVEPCPKVRDRYRYTFGRQINKELNGMFELSNYLSNRQEE